MKYSLNAGDLDQRITLEQRADALNERGEMVPTWSTFAQVWASADPVRGREYFAAGQMQATIDVRFTIRYRADIHERMRVLWRGKPYDIVSPPIEVKGARVALELMCVNGVRDGR